jgi:hypothetical protein
MPALACGEPITRGQKSPLEVIEVESSPHVKSVVKKNDSAFPSAAISGDRKAGSGECLPELPDGGYGLPSTTTSHRIDLQAKDSSLPVENRFGIQVDTLNVSKIQRETGQVEDRNSVKIERGKNKKGTQVLGYVPLQIMNLSLEEVEVEKQRCVGVASPIQIIEDKRQQSYEINPIFKDDRVNTRKFDEYLQDKLKHLDKKERSVLQPVLRKYKNVFYGLGSTELGSSNQVEHSIETGDAQPIKKNPYRTPHALKPIVEEHINDMLEKNIIEPSMSPWSSRIVLVQKKSKDWTVKYRFCVDYRALNAVTKPDAYPIPNIVDTLDSLGHSKIFSVLDMASGYHQIPVKLEHREKTAFSCHQGHFQFVKMPFGLNNAPATYQRYIDIVLMGLKGVDCLVYLDDVICFSATMEEHAKKLQAIFERLKQANFKIQPEKCVFATDTVEYLGHICTPLGVKPDPGKVRAIKDYPVPKTVRDIRSFIGLAGYYRRHVQDFAKLAQPLTNLTKKDVPFIWTDEHQLAFENLKQILSTEHLLIYPDFTQPFIVACDASTKAIGAVLSQVREGEERPVAYCSRQLNSAESKYSVTELELLAFLFATKQFRCYLYGRKFTVHTDHRALKWLLNLQDPSSRLTRWAVKLSEYDFVVEHRPGTKMRHADALSRSVNQVGQE